ncbi:MAG: PorP/SprF family type IX secretion system membrane protein [Bacteroidia bacterium]|nr:PorP/SprF family type IX secretion system membrane protein [Bacteroidia bacterium]
MIKSIRNSVLVGLFSMSALVNAQDIHFSQFDQAPLFLNPALTCLTSDFRITLNYKDQWGSISPGAPFRTYAFTGEMALFKKRGKGAYMGVGLTAFADKAGDIEYGNKTVRATVSGVVPVNETNTLSAGLQGGFGQLSYNQDKMKWGSQYNGTAFDPTMTGETPNSAQESYGDFSLGVHWAYGKDQMYISANDNLKFNVGLAMYHLNAPKVSFYTNNPDKLFSKYVIHSSCTVGIKNTNLQLLPSMMYLVQGPSTELTFGTLIKYILREDSKYTGFVKGADVGLGLYMRAKDAVIAQLLLEFGNYGLGVSYDVNTSDLRAATNAKGGLEVMLRYRSPNPFLYQSRAQF